MARTRTTPTARLTPTYGTSSGTNPGEDFEAPEDLSDIAGIDAEIPRGNARPTGSLLQPKPKPRSPIGVEIGKSAGGGLGVVVAVPLGAGPISARGGINLGAGGAIKGGSIGLGFGLGPIGGSIDVGTDQDEEGRGGCYQYVTVTAGPFSHTYGRNVCEPKPPPGVSGIPPDTPGVYNSNPNNLSLSNRCSNGVTWTAWMAMSNEYGRQIAPLPLSEGLGVTNKNWEWYVKNMNGSDYVGYQPKDDADADNYFGKDKWVMLTKDYIVEGWYSSWWTNGSVSRSDSIAYIIQRYGYTEYFHKDYLNFGGLRGIVFGFTTTLGNLRGQPTCSDGSTGTPISDTPPTVNLPLSPPVPNPPPKKKMDDACCKKSLILQAEILRLLGRELGTEGLVPQTKKVGFIGEEIERTETPILDPEKPKKIKVRFETIYDLLKYALRQANNLDTALDPQSYKPPTGKVQNPAYNRDSEESLKSNNQPNKDKAGNKRELEINKDDEVKMGGFLQQQQYIFDALRRLEYLFPSGELSDALIAKSLLIPGAKDDIKIHNMIMAYELQMQYLDAALGNPREKLVIKDANPAIEGDQPIEVTALSISDLLRQNIKFHIDTGGDVDALVNLVLRDFRTNLANRIDLIKSAEMVQALFEDSGMLEKQEYIDIHLEGDVYAGQWIKGQGFKANPNLEKKTEEATEEVLRATMKPVDQKIKVSRRSKDEKTDMRDLLRGLADFIQRLVSIPSAGDAGKAIDKLVESAKFKVQTDMALLRQNVTQAAAASRNRTKKRKK